MIMQLHPKNPEIRTLKAISSKLKEGKVYIFPTDTVYAIICDTNSKEGNDRMQKLKDSEKHKPFSLLCSDISTASEFIEYFPNEAFKLMKKVTPGPFTFILKANKNLPRWSVSNQKTKTIGIRIPENLFLKELLKVHEGTITSTSVFTEDRYITEIEDLDKLYGNYVEGIIDGGIAKVEMSTIIDFTGDEMVIVREGKGSDRL